VTVDTLEKKHGSMKEARVDGLKEQQRVRSLEKQADAKAAQIKKLQEENNELKKRYLRFVVTVVVVMTFVRFL